jgi:uncharacterized protein YtpQ (UPF0354 family)
VLFSSSIQSSSLIQNLAEQSDSIQAIQFTINGKPEYLVDYYKQNVEVVVNDVKNLLDRFSEVGSKAVKGIIQKIKAPLNQAMRTFELVTNEAHILGLIQSAECVQQSLFRVLTTVLLLHSESE